MTDTHTTNLDELFELIERLMRKAAEQENEKAMNVLTSMLMVLPVLGGNVDVAAKTFDEHVEKFEEMLRADNTPEVDVKEALRIVTHNALKALMIEVASACVDDQARGKLAAEFRRSIEAAAVELNKS